MSQNQTKKKGFTLIETVTTVGIIAVLAAVVVPTVAQQYNNADPTRFAQDMADLRTAIQTFNIDVKGKYPGDLEDLSFRITSTTDSSLQADTTGFGNTFVKVFSSSDNSAWNGPYIDFPFVDNGSKSTAYNANISDQLYPFSATDSLFGYETGATSPSQVAIKITGLDSTKFEALNKVIDGTETVGSASATSSMRAGKLRAKRGSGTYTVYYLATPIQ